VMMPEFWNFLLPRNPNLFIWCKSQCICPSLFDL